MSDPRKPAPGSNSWAQSSEQRKAPKTDSTGPKQSGPPTNRSKYENKPMPPTPKASPPSSTQAGSMHPCSIQPVTPLLRPPQSHQNVKDRAVTDPVIARTLNVTTKKSLTKLSEGSEQNSQRTVVNDEIPLQNPLPTLPFAVTNDGSEVMHARPVGDNNQDELSFSAPPTTSNTPHPFSSQSENGLASPQVHPYHRQEKNWPTPLFSYATLTRNPHKGDEEKYGPITAIVKGDRPMNPTRDGGWGYIHDIEIVHPSDSQRVTSQIGVIDTVESQGPSNAPGYRTYSEESLSLLEGRKLNFNDIKPQPSTSSLRSESNYGGVWENHPHVGRSLPPFTPSSPRLPSNPKTISHLRSISSRSAIAPIMLENSRGTRNRSSSQSTSVSYKNPWIPSPQGNSFASPSIPSVINASGPNAVPPPPVSYPGFQPSVQIPAGMERMERNLHHHLDQCFGNLARSMTDKSDKVADQMMRQMENFEEKVDKVLRGIKGELRELKKDVGSRNREIKEISKLNESIQKQVSRIDTAVKEITAAVKEMDVKIDALETKIEKESESEHVVFVGRRTESAHATFGQNGQRQPPPSCLHGLRQDRQISRGRQTAVDDAGGSGVRRNTSRSTGGEIPDHMGVTNYDPPDLSQHPAYRRERVQSPEHKHEASRVPAGFVAMGSNSYPTSSFENGGWYHQAYPQ